MPRVTGKSLAWEVDWSKRMRPSRTAQPSAWARNPKSHVRSVREWHWTSYTTLKNAGIDWPPRVVAPKTVRSSGYVCLRRSVMTQEQITCCDENQLWEGWNRGRRLTVKEHRLVACMKYGHLPPRVLVRHVNGDKTDNRPENLVLGSHRDNAIDHKSAVALALHWKERALKAERAQRFTFVLAELAEAA